MFFAFLNTIALAIVSFPLVYLIVFPVIWALHRAFSRELGMRRIVVFYGLGQCIWGALLLTNLPVPEFFDAFCSTRKLRSMVLLEPFKFAAPARYYFSELLRNGVVPGHFFFWQSFLNFLMLIPAGILFRILKKRNFLIPMAVGFLSAMFLELTQLTGIWGIAPCPYRTFDVDDIILNSSGFIAGWIGMSVLFFGWKILMRNRTGRPANR